MVGKYGEVYVVDWGLARVLGCEDRRDLRLTLPDVNYIATPTTITLTHRPMGGVGGEAPHMHGAKPRYDWARAAERRWPPYSWGSRAKPAFELAEA